MLREIKRTLDRRAAWRALLVAALFAAILSLSASGRACSCSEDVGPPTGAVFRGRVTDVHVPILVRWGLTSLTVESISWSVGWPELAYIVTRFEVLEAWQAVGTREVEVLTDEYPCGKGVVFQEGEEWLVGADATEGRLYAGFCEVARKADVAGDLLADLGPGFQPTAPYRSPHLVAAWIAATLAFGAIAAFASYALRRPRRDRQASTASLDE